MTSGPIASPAASILATASANVAAKRVDLRLTGIGSAPLELEEVRSLVRELTDSADKLSSQRRTLAQALTLGLALGLVVLAAFVALGVSANLTAPQEQGAPPFKGEWLAVILWMFATAAVTLALQADAMAREPSNRTRLGLILAGLIVAVAVTALLTDVRDAERNPLFALEGLFIAAVSGSLLTTKRETWVWKRREMGTGSYLLIGLISTVITIATGGVLLWAPGHLAS